MSNPEKPALAPGAPAANLASVEPLPTVMQLMHKSATWLKQKGISNARREAEWLFAHGLHCTRLDLYLRFDMPMTEAEQAPLRALLRRRGAREPLAYILGTQPFGALDLQVGPGVLVPRPETETLVELALVDLPPGGLVLDVGTGSGAIALAIASSRPDARVLASEFSPAALPIAHANAQRLHVPIRLLRADLATAIGGGVDLLLANLPYIAVEEAAVCDPELGYEPAEALYADDGGLALIKRLLADTARVLAPQGTLWLEHGFAQTERVLAAAQALGLHATAHADAAKVVRFARVRRAG